MTDNTIIINGERYLMKDLNENLALRFADLERKAEETRALLRDIEKQRDNVVREFRSRYPNGAEVETGK